MPKGSVVPDLVVDAERGRVYLADVASATNLSVHIDSGKVRLFSGQPSLQAEPEARMRADGILTHSHSKPTSTGLNPLTLSRKAATHFITAP
ncbi:hypothetical protein F2P45_22200 [Massilia sp. CCM 8733]|uniref:Uncharacterized protein n=1 Tax=Massilia mucilaginosa TaxID=2609282 RepID=A0ABX0NXU0_9BURK|nr:hypothetical protein [Massilia mucilaginosa]NHZ91697.1 hypothetical protein [Massilia mucilaginosa]